MSAADFTLSAVPLRGPLAPLAALLGEGDYVITEAHPDRGVWRGPITARDDRPSAPGWVWLDCLVWVWVPLSRVDAVDLVTSPAARSAVVAWLASQGHADAGKDDAALLNALRAVCGLPAVVPPTDCDDDHIPL